MALALLIQDSPRCGKFSSRVQFWEASKKLKEDFVRNDVERILGKPDHAFDDEKWTVWEYGTSGPDTLPTLGTVTFREGKLTACPYWHQSPPSPSLISEKQLRITLQELYQIERTWLTPKISRPLSQDPMLLVKATNFLTPFGKEKATAIILEFAQVHGDRTSVDSWLNWLVRVLYLPGKDGKIRSAQEGYVASLENQKRNGQLWPEFPVFICKGVPINFHEGTTIIGKALPFSWHFMNEVPKLAFRKEPLTLPDDPFEIEPIMESRNKDWDMYRVRRQVMILIKSAYDPLGKMLLGSRTEKSDFEQYHQEYLKLGCHWDKKLNLYVRKDGSYDLPPNQEEDR